MNSYYNEEEFLAQIANDTETDVEELKKNPLMDRLQAALRKQLQKTHERVKRELQEQEELLRRAKEQREECGVQLYGAQQQLSRVQLNLESIKDKEELIAKSRIENEKSNKELKKVYQDKENNLNDLKRAVASSMAELNEHIQTIEQIAKYNEEMKSEISVTKRAASKVKESVKDQEKKKNIQDTYIDTLYEQQNRYEVEVNLTESYIKAQKEQTAKAKLMIQETNIELEQLMKEKKDLLQRWNSSIVALRRRDEALSSATKELKDIQASCQDIKCEVDRFRRDTFEVESKKETLIAMKDRIQVENNFLEESIERLHQENQKFLEKQEIIKGSISKAKEEEDQWTVKISKLSNSIKGLSNKIEVTNKEKHALEDQIGLNKHEQSTLTKTKQHLVQDEKVLLNEIHNKEVELENIKNEMARIKIDSLNVQVHNDQLKLMLDECIKDINEKEIQVEKYEMEIRRKNSEIEMKMRRVEQLNRKYEDMKNGVDEPEVLGPLEATIKSLTKEINETGEECQLSQENWLKNQTHLIEAISEANAIQEKNTETNARNNILSQKRLRLIQDIHREEAEIKAINSSVTAMYTDMSRLNDLIGRNTKQLDEVSDQATLREKEFTQELKELQNESNFLDEKILNVKSAKSQLLEDLVTVEKAILNWEKKIKLEKETQAALTSSEDADEIKGMESEIVRMKHKLELLSREQEKMVRDMEQAIHKREDIAVKYNNTKERCNDRNKSRLTASQLKRMVIDTKDLLKKIELETTVIDTQVEKYKHMLETSSRDLFLANIDLETHQVSSTSLQDSINLEFFEKQRLESKRDFLENILEEYQKADLDDKLFVSSTLNNDFELETEYRTALSKLRRVTNVISGLRVKFPHIDVVFKQVELLASEVAAHAQK